MVKTTQHQGLGEAVGEGVGEVLGGGFDEGDRIFVEHPRRAN